MPNHRGGRYGVDNPKKNIVTFKVTDDELFVLDTVSEIFDSRSDMIRTVLFDFALELNPEEVKEHINKKAIEQIRRKLK